MGFKPNKQTPKKKEEAKLPDNFLPDVNLTVKDLPSRSLPYPPAAEIKYRPYVFGEIKKISQSKMSERDVFDMVLSGVECKGFDKYDLTVQDTIYIGLLRRMSTFGERGVQVTWNCKCGSENSLPLDMMGLEFNDMEAEKLPVSIDINNVELKFMPLTVSKMFEMLGDNNENADEVDFLAKCVSNIDTEKAKQIIYNCDAQDVDVLREVDRQLNHELKPLDIKCQKCKFESTLALDGGQGLLMPFRESKESVRRRIRFG